MEIVELAAVILLLAASLAALLKFRRMWVRSSNRAYRFEPRPTTEGPLVSVVIPARNEEANLPALLEGLLKQVYRTVEIFIVDDESTDATGRIAAEAASRDERISLLQAGKLPDGWTGKNHACWRGASEARGEYLLFLDCDVRLVDTGVIGAMADYATRESTDLYSVIPRQHLRAFWERLFGPAVYTVMGFAFLPLEEVNDPASPKAAAVGQCMFFRKSSYDELDGHRRLRGHIVEDIDFARLFKSSGRKLALHYGAGDVTVRMYTGLAAMWEGWGKNLYRAAAGTPARLLSIELQLFLAYLMGPVLVAYSAIRLLLQPSATGSLALLAAAALTAWGHLLRLGKYRALGWPARYEVAHEAGVVFAMVLLVVSAFKDRAVGGLSWKGRSYTGGAPGSNTEQDAPPVV